MTSRGEVRVGESVQNLIAGIEDVLRLAAPARDQMIGLQSYMKQLISVNDGMKKEAYRGLHTKDDLPASGNDNTEAVFAEVERMMAFAKEEFRRIQAAKNNQIRDLENERRELQENTQRTVEEQLRRIQKLSDENEHLKKAAANQNNKIRELENERRDRQENAHRTEEEQRCLILTLSEENDQLKKAASNYDASNSQIRELKNERQELLANAQMTVEEQRRQIQKLLEEINQLKEAAENQKLIMEKNTKLFTKNRETLLQEKEKLQNELAILSRSPTTATIAHGEDFQQIQVICELYRKLYTNIWPSAFEQGKKTFIGQTDYMIIKAIQDVLQEFIHLANKECQTQGTELERALKWQSKNELTPDHNDAIRRVRWTLVQFAVDTVSQKMYRIRSNLQRFAEQIRPFVNECVHIGFLMSLHEQRIVVKECALYGTDFNENVYEKCFPEGNKVDCVVWPALMFINGQVIAKGVVQCYKADPPQSQWQTNSNVV